MPAATATASTIPSPASLKGPVDGQVDVAALFVATSALRDAATLALLSNQAVFAQVTQTWVFLHQQVAFVGWRAWGKHWFDITVLGILIFKCPGRHTPGAPVRVFSADSVRMDRGFKKLRQLCSINLQISNLKQLVLQNDSSEDGPLQDGLGGGIDYDYHDDLDDVVGEPQPENTNADMPAQPFPELDNIFDGWDERLPDFGPLDEFSTDPDEEIFERLGRLNVEDSEDSSDEEPPIPEGEDINLNEQEDGALFISQGTHFNFSDVREAADIHANPPPCMDDHPAVHNAYIQAFISAAFYNAANAAVYHDLEGKEHLLCTAQQENPEIEYPGLDEYAHTLPTLLKRLGLSADQFIIYFFICDVCWKLHHPSVLSELKSPNCTVDDCEGALYTQKRLSDGTTKRTPTKIVPYVPPEHALQQFLLRPGKWEQLQHWRGPGDEPSQVPPIPGRGFDSFRDPSKPMKDIYDGYGWRAIQAGLERRRGGRWEIQDVDVHELHQRFVSLPCGLVWQIDIDWFQAVKEETILVMVIPGPDKPSLEQMNHLLEPFVESLLCLKKGVEFTVHGYEDPQLSHSHLYCNVSDLPSSRKVTGLQGHNSKFFMCPTSFNYREDWRYLKYSFCARNAEPAIADAIHENRGVRCWMPAGSSVIEFMHAVFLTCDQQGSPKTDQWRNQVLILFVALYEAWEYKSEIPDEDALPSPPNTKNSAAQATMQKTLRSRLMEHLLARNPDPSDADIARVNSAKMDRNLRRHYNTILEFCAAVPDDIHRGCAALSRATQSWAQMGCHLTLYFHFANHLEEQMYRFGPCYATWAFAFERHNGRLARINHNQHKGGELEGTLMRRWWSVTFNYDLILHIEALPNRTDDDEDSICLLQMCLKAQQRDRLSTVINNNLNAAIFAKHPKKLNLSSISDNVYQIVYKYLRNKWRPLVHLKTSTSIIGNGENFMGNASSYSHLWLRRLRYGAVTAHRGKSAQYAYINGHQPVEIQWLLHVSHDRTNGDEPLVANIAIVRCFVPDDRAPDFPWAIWATDLGVASWRAEALGELEVVPIDSLSGHFVLAPIQAMQHEVIFDFWITIAYDHSNPEADIEIDIDND
ncbi:hypothetical protein DEU56DRAFT_757923 [Suillus clintonianus]|uniref:uncharacterized protein n=1 Tax=Suillus clintonianus TaxID=1904413 RepID=UPI001B861A85|nr:uncharacterized protein DEU56DRAFT_757923 [Suillus clintonianus]KAG2130249.1 hypothetical protein DEU56DRAFT_757923 [Suillus clintonianus]